MKIAVVGATGLVGGVMLKVLEERGFGGEEVIAAASPRSIGKELPFCGRTLKVMSVEDAIAAKPHYAIFSAGADASRQYAPLFAQAGTRVIDNSSAWRKDKGVPLVVPEINMDSVGPHHMIIANPNCSTIQMVLAISQLHKRYGIRRIVVSTYQSITGTGMKAIRQLEAEEQLAHDGKGMETPHPMAYPHPIHHNLFPHGGDFLDDGYTTEERKLIDETHKILRDDTIRVSPTVARVPVMGGHSESVNLELATEYDLAEAIDTIRNTRGVVVCDDPATNTYPTPLMAHHRDEVLVGRIRRDISVDNGLNLWIVADNLRKGAATNAVQILQELVGR